MAQNAEIFFEHDSWPRALGWSAGFHVAFTALVILFSYILTGARGSDWGGGGGGEAMGVTLVSSVPLPATAAQTQNVLANESKGVTKSEPKVEEKEPDAIEVQGKNTKIKPKKPPTPSLQKNQPPPPPSNQVAFGEGSPVSGPYGGSAASGAKMGVSGSGGDFGTKYGWYVQIIQQKVSENWLKYEVDSKVTGGQRVYLTFDIARDGHPFNVQVEKPSGVQSLDDSAKRALLRIDTFGPLPQDYHGNKISVEYWFDYSR